MSHRDMECDFVTKQASRTTSSPPIPGKLLPMSRALTANSVQSPASVPTSEQQIDSTAPAPSSAAVIDFKTRQILRPSR
jgi:hypothetical protein